MLNKIKTNILPMLDTLGDALTQYLSRPEKELRAGISEFIDAINSPMKKEHEDVISLSLQLKESLESPVLAEVEALYNSYCTEIENIPVQYKAVFLPYYDNTWDSLASVYEAFAADPIFVTEIVIIPIKRNTPTGWKLVYEDYLTPKGIPNTPFLNYSFEEDKPDFVFYNNPYDGVNIEKFQSQNIKPHVGCMVYIPYFLYVHEFKNNENLLKSITQHTELPGHDNADIFVTQGKSFQKMFENRSRNGKKMVMLGNPKSDNIYKHGDNYIRYPEWDNIAQGKTAFLLNTHYSSVLDGSLQSFFPSLLEYIKKNEDTALIWRPHPQTFLMFEQSDPHEGAQIFMDYMKQLGNCKRVIIDRTENSLSALMYSNAVISQRSSIIAEAVLAEKPIFVLGTEFREILTYEAWEKITVEDYMQRLKQVRKYDTRNLFLFSAVCYYGLDRAAPKEEIKGDYIIKVPMLEFMDDIRNGIDIKKELRGMFREQLFVNSDGTCGQKIHDYIVDLIKQNQ